MSKVVSELTVPYYPLPLEVIDWLKANTTAPFSLYYFERSDRCVISLSSDSDSVHFKLMFSDLLAESNVRV